jgi:hypothetical protein
MDSMPPTYLELGQRHHWMTQFDMALTCRVVSIFSILQKIDKVSYYSNCK